MGLGNRGFNSLVFVKIDKDSGVFYVQEDGNRKEFKSLSGLLIKVERTDFEFKGKKMPKCNYVFQDGNDKYSVSFGYDTYPNLSILNSLALIKNFNKEICIFIKLLDDNLRVGIAYDGDKTEWFYNVEQLTAEGVYGAEKVNGAKEKIIDKLLSIVQTNLNEKRPVEIEDIFGETDKKYDEIPF